MGRVPVTKRELEGREAVEKRKSEGEGEAKSEKQTHGRSQERKREGPAQPALPLMFALLSDFPLS